MDLKQFFKSEEGISPIVATLVLVVVAIAGAAGVGTIMGSFSSDVSDDASATEASSAASTELLIAGSSTVQPVSELLAEAYMKEHPGVKVTVQGGGSGAGITSTQMDIVDIGAASKDVDTVTEYPDLEKHTIGGSGLVIIGNDASSIGLDGANVSAADLKTIYDNVVGGTVTVSVDGNGTLAYDAAGTTVTVFQRSDASGTEETFDKWVDEKGYSDETEAIGKEGNSGVLAAVEDTDDSIAFVDYGFYASGDGIVAINPVGYTVSKDNILDCLAGEDTYDSGLTRPLNYLTNGAPSSVEQSYIQFAMSPASKQYFNEVGYFSIIEFA
ncbi:phosphate transport system substrate-binding protein [Methanohalophilus levihalophilus]|uniref:PstS family phosphate ABC transporter substrate-binding protein n=1 Tax=Methanohalophilus levihalophilus TaxID=1431282 RepID=UPI001AE944BA|nr:substrate-binding domain-containing protein [Methanohalophilus levihalophilus]MBP2029444.1 phosphate transport system substrate-binding protein [Methanohalophilus levihalophilus]